MVSKECIKEFDSLHFLTDGSQTFTNVRNEFLHIKLNPCKTTSSKYHVQ